MEALGTLAAGGILGLITGFIVCAHLFQQNVMKPALWQLARTEAHDRKNYLRILRRELANHLLQRSPTEYLEFMRRVQNEVERYSTFSKEALVGELRGITERYPQFDDFDFIGTRSHILYPDAFDRPDDDIREHYRNIIRFTAINAKLDDNWKPHLESTIAEDLKHLEDYVQEVLDARFRKRIIVAMHTYFQTRSGSLEPLDTPELSIRPITQKIDLRYGIHFKDTDEYGLYTTFYDDEREKTYRSYFRSDPSFSTEGYLNARVRLDYEQS